MSCWIFIQLKCMPNSIISHAKPACQLYINCSQVAWPKPLVGNNFHFIVLDVDEKYYVGLITEDYGPV